METWKRSTAFFLAGQTVSLFGSSLVQYAIMWHLTLETRSGAVMTGYIIAGFLPSILLAPVAGVWADRHDRKRLIALADGFIALASLAAAILLRFGLAEIPLFFTVAALRSLGSAVHQPAVGAFLPRIVPRDELTRVNGINGGIQSALMLVSPVAAGALLAAFDVPLIFLIDVVTAALAIVVLLSLVRELSAADGVAGAGSAPTDGVAPVADSVAVGPSGASGHFRDIADGLAYIRGHRYLTSFFAYMGLLFFLVSPAAFLTTIQTARSFGGEVWRLTSLEIVFSVGMMGGGAAIATWGGFRNRMRTVRLGNLIMAVCTLGLAASPLLPKVVAFPAYLVFMGIFGIAIPLLNTPSTVLLQEHVEDAFLGRTFAVFSMVSGSLMPVAMLVFGPIADVVSVELVLAVSGALLLALGLVSVTQKRLMEAGEPVAKGQE
jgi:MFS transporter, DHA3 family, macrolide efflux protein